MAEERRASWMYVVTGVFIVTVCIAFARLAYGVVLPFMRDGLNISYQDAGFLGTATSFGYLSTVVFAGVAAAKWGGKRTMLLGLFLITSGFAGLALTPSYGLGFVFMCLLGIGTAFTFTPLVAVLTGWFPAKKGLVIGFINGGAGIGMLFAGLIVPYLVKLNPETGWRIVWAVFSMIGVVVLIKTAVCMHNPPPIEPKKPFTPDRSPRAIFLNRKVLIVAILYGMVGITFISQATFILSFMLESAIAPDFAGQLVTLNGILSIFSAPVWGGISDKLGRKVALILVMGLNLIATLTPVVFPSPFGFACNSMINGAIGTGMFTLIQALSTELVHPRDSSVVLGYVTFFFAFGQLIGPAVSGWLIDQAGGFVSAFLFISVCLLIGLSLTMKLQTKKTEPANLVRESDSEIV